MNQADKANRFARMYGMGPEKMIGRRGRSGLIESTRDPACSKCQLCKSSTNVCIMGRGNVMGSIMLIGEAPGAAESLHGKPFCGESGKLLQGHLESLGMADMVYITNAAKCRPPQNRDPTTFELVQCKPYLIREFEVIQPVVVVVLGRIAMSTLHLSNEPRHRLRYDHRFPFMIVSTWHPAYCLRMGRSSLATKQLVEALASARTYVTSKQVRS